MTIASYNNPDPVQLRRVYRLGGFVGRHPRWEETQMEKLKRGDRFYLVDPPSDKPPYEDGSRIYLALADAHFDDIINTWVVQAEVIDRQ